MCGDFSPPELQMYSPSSSVPYSEVSTTPLGSVTNPFPKTSRTYGISPADVSALKALDRSPFLTVTMTTMTLASKRCMCMRIEFSLPVPVLKKRIRLDNSCKQELTAARRKVSRSESGLLNLERSSALERKAQSSSSATRTKYR